MKAFLIDREDLRQSMQVIINVTKEVKQGRNYLIFAEGTRSKNGNHPQEFKGGSFKAAMKAKCPIVPVALIDSYKSFDTGSAAPITVQVHFLKPMRYEIYRDCSGSKTQSRRNNKEKRRMGLTIAVFLLHLFFQPSEVSKSFPAYLYYFSKINRIHTSLTRFKTDFSKSYIFTIV